MPARLLVLDLATGKELWSSTREIFGTWLSYSIEHDVLVEAGRTARDTLSDEARGMRAYAAKNGPGTLVSQKLSRACHAASPDGSDDGQRL